jgi:phage shock protein C
MNKINKYIKMKRYYRVKKDNVIAGVCGGFGEYFNIDPLFIRLLFVFAVILLPKSGFPYITDGTIIGFYLIMWFVTSYKPNTTNE